MAAEFPGPVSIIDYGDLLSPQGVFTEYLDGVQVRTPDGVHTPAYAKGNVFVGNSTEAVAHAFYNWLAPRIWPLIIASNGSPATAASSDRAQPPATVTRPTDAPGRTARYSTPALGHRQGADRRPRRPAGLRPAIIMGYHFGVGWLQGGFFSLDIFYVLSGYLITGLLLGEWPQARPASSSAPSGCAGPGACCRRCWWCWWW